VAPLGLAAFWFGPQWPLRVASVIFQVGMVIALRLPPRADSEPPERVPRPLRALRRKGDRPLGRGRPAGRLVIATLIGAAGLRALYGFLLLFLAFALKKGDLTNDLFGRELNDQAALGLIGGALAVGGFLATAVGTRLRIHRPAAIQSSTMIIVAGVGILTVLKFSLPMVALFCLVAALSSGIAKLAVDASIQERIPERLRASSFAHSETVLMLAFVAGGGLGLVPFEGRIGIAVAAGVGVLAAVRGVVVAGRLRAQRLLGRPLTDEELAAQDRADAADDAARRARSGRGATDDPAARTGGDAADRPDGDRAGPTTDQLAESADDAAAEAAARAAPTSPAPSGAGDSRSSADGLAPPGYHIYRPSSAVPGSGSGVDDDQRRQSPGSVS
jgi:hypothetical protein